MKLTLGLTGCAPAALLAWMWWGYVPAVPLLYVPQSVISAGSLGCAPWAEIFEESFTSVSIPAAKRPRLCAQNPPN